MYDSESLEQILREYDAWVVRAMSPEGRARMIARGLQPEAELKKVSDLKNVAIAANQACENAKEQLLHRAADMADSQYELFKCLRQVVQEQNKVNPLDSRLQEWEDYLEALSEHMPKGQEE